MDEGPFRVDPSRCVAGRTSTRSDRSIGPDERCHDEAQPPLSRYRPSRVLRSFFSARITWTMYTVFCS